VERIRFEVHEGKGVLVIDLSDLDGPPGRAVLQRAHREVTQLPKEPSLLSRLIVRGFATGSEANAWLLAEGEQSMR
jgi:hypothetical protein